MRVVETYQQRHHRRSSLCTPTVATVFYSYTAWLRVNVPYVVGQPRFSSDKKFRILGVASAASRCFSLANLSPKARVSCSLHRNGFPSSDFHTVVISMVQGRRRARLRGNGTRVGPLLARNATCHSVCTQESARTP
jgi:hypothetical protein